jgi:regulator of replication initiation timing
MTENELTLTELFFDTYRKPGATWDDASNTVAAEAVRRLFRDLPPGDDGLYEAYIAGCRTVGMEETPVNRHKAGIAAVCALLKQRGWIDTSRLPPGDEGLEVARRTAAQCTTQWDDMDRQSQSLSLLGIAAVKAVAEREFRERFVVPGWLSPNEAAKLRKQFADSVWAGGFETKARYGRLLDDMTALAHDWKRSIDEGEKLRAENERLGNRWILCAFCGEKLAQANCADPGKVLRTHAEQCAKHPIARYTAENERLKRYVAFHEQSAREQGREQKRSWDDNKKLLVEVVRLEAELAKAKATKPTLADWVENAAVPMSQLALENERLRATMRNAARKLRRGVGDEP